jgi:4a-hydroxytetrahydrobiopterin dehydratase
MALEDQICSACRGDEDPLGEDEILNHLLELGDEWSVVEDHHLERHFEFEDFQEALEFVNKVGEIAEDQGHHPNIEFTWGEATIKLYTHKIDGLHENDFIMAAKIGELYDKEFEQ